MANAFDGYCYATLGEALTAELSKPIHVTGINQAVAPYSYAGSGVQAGVITFKNPDGSTFSVLKTYPICTTVGPLATTGFNYTNANEIIGAVSLLFAVAFVFRAILHFIQNR